MERLSLLVRQSGFTLQQVGPTAGQAPAAAPAPAPTAMTFTLTLYSSSKTGSSQP